jgi:hypothetical protein
MKQTKLYTLIPLEEFKAVLSGDDRDDKLSRYCLTISSFTIEQHCHRRFLVKRHFENLAFWGESVIPLTNYPIIEILAVYAREAGQREMSLVEPDFYSIEPEAGKGFDIPVSIALSPALRLLCGERSLRVIYKAGYSSGKVPSDLVTACLELAAWNMSRYKGRRIGLMGAVRGNGKDGEHLEASMPENVRRLLEPYKRKLI